MKYLAGIGSVKSPGDIISEQSCLPIKDCLKAFKLTFIYFKAIELLMGWVSVVHPTDTEASFFLGHGATIAVVTFL